MASVLTPDQTAHFSTTGWLLTEPFGAPDIARLRGWVDEIAAWPTDGAGWLHHHELTDDGPVLARSERLIEFHPGLAALLTTGTLAATASDLLGEPAVLYKEKINYKLAGGAGYAPHQDAPAYPMIDLHVSAMVAVDDATVDNGCLEVASGRHHELLPTDERGCVHPDVAAELDWQPVEVRAGQVLWFHSRTPHRSGPNTSGVPRRALYPTYNAASEGDLRRRYYETKLATFAEAEDEPAGSSSTARVSLIGDFQGRAVT